MKIHAFIIGTLLLALMSACGNGNPHTHGGDAESSDPASHKAGSATNHSGEIILSLAQAKAAGIKTETVTPGKFHGIVRTSGKVLTASGDETTVAATASGMVSLSRPLTEGMAIGRGVAVCAISSSGLQDGDASRRADIAYRTAKAEYERAKKLVADKIISEKDFLTIKADYENARLAYHSMVQGSSSKGVVVKAPAGGYVKECLVKEGDYVSVGQPLMIVTQNKNLYLRAELAERNYNVLNQITSAKFRMSYSDRVYDLEELKGRLVSYGKTSGAASSFLPVTFEFANAGGIVPGAFAEIYLITATRDNVITVPVTALTEEQGVHFVYVRESAEVYRKCEVRLGVSDGVRTEVLSGLKGGEKLVTEGAVHVKLASASNRIPEHNHSH
ncbi:MAG: efflux RND transporter periplasmic adaptor subunit [Bacteroidales bacterium]|nr:efflux RND transporter periplasmic adaptor subunit [Bacteroidales bacterium]MCM1148013.1 efflux RND transporter periplasmic adaptor subunit [Bacteroidales bacterium]MCM1206831.1 efflux RND transporter periplasmic adaptor subunit [Bacillota bacterium]MCM1511031.1 efflux RND transporter periplasmic adaptor subunit [Clostridium sp.]